MRKEPLRPVDWAFLIGGPIVFLAIAWFGLQAIIGPPPPLPAVQRIQQGAIRIGMTEGEVIRAVGSPRSVAENEDGTYTFRYQRSRWNPDARIAIEEDAFVDFSPNGVVTAITFESL